MIAEALKQNVPVYVVSISEKVGIGKKMIATNIDDWDKILSDF